MHPKAKFIPQFIEQDFDILFDLRKANELPLAYIVELSKARFKVGSGKSDNFGPYDIQIETTEEMTIPSIIDQMVYYMDSIDFINSPDQTVKL